MSVQSEIDRIIAAVGNAYSKVSQKGGTVPASQTVANLATAIESIPAGGGGAPSLQSKSVTITSNGTVSVTPDAPYDALSSVDVTVNVASGGGGVAGFSVTFPATATNWGKAADADLLLSDGTVKSFLSYSEVSGKTIENVVGIHCVATLSFYVLTMTLSEGSLAQCTIGSRQSNTYRITTSNKTTMAFYGSGKSTFWWPLADTVISAIEMYNTD